MDTKAPVKPGGFSTLSPHLIVSNIEDQLGFMKGVFKAELVDDFRRPDGLTIHATARIGETTIMIGLASPEFPAIQSMLHLFVDDPDEVYRRALKHHATSIEEPADQFFGHRQGAVRDPQGNIWWIARFIRKVSEQELQEFFKK